MAKQGSRAKPIWYGAIGAAGFGFGMIGEHRPFGDDMLAHPLVVYFLAVAGALVVLRLGARRPVPELVPERALIAGCIAGLALFLVGNFIAAHLIGR